MTQALALSKDEPGSERHSDPPIRLEVLTRLGEQSWTDFSGRHIIVAGGVGSSSGVVGSAEERKALERRRRCGGLQRTLVIAFG
jgi:hypothetical protein